MLKINLLIPIPFTAEDKIRLSYHLSISFTLLLARYDQDPAVLYIILSVPLIYIPIPLNYALYSSSSIFLMR